jgi:hypothetical protein
MTFGMGIIHDANLFEIVRHPWFISAFLAGGAAQILKFVIGSWRARRMDLSYLAGAGGMPSSHSALVSALATAVGLTEGFDAPDAMIAVGFGLLVLCDAMTLRRAAGEHAKLLNRIVVKLNDGLDEADRLEAERLRERLGHSRREVLAGMVFGIAVAFFVCAVWDFWKS